MRGIGRVTQDRSRQVLESGENLGEPRIFPTLAILGSAGLYATLPSRFIAGPSSGVFSVARWILPALAVLLLAALIVSAPDSRVVQKLQPQTARLHLGRRVATLGLTGLLSAANGAAIVLLVHLLVNGARAQAPLLLRAGIHMWCMNVLVFALWFWELDNGGPVARQTAGPDGRDFLFPQQTLPEPSAARWQPLFLDYLYLAFTNATAFSPTDALPLSRWAKMLMLVESATSLVLAVMVAARAVNILK